MSGYKPTLSGNIPKLYLIKMAKWFSLIMPVIVLFYQDNGLSMSQIFWLKSVYSIGMFAFEIPSGYFGDVWGRKKTLILGSILTFFGFSVYCFSSLFWQFMLAELFLGIGQSFVSGSDSAMLYDTLQAEKRENEYLEYEGKVTSVGNISEGVAGILGGLLALVTLRLPFIAQAAFSALAIPASIMLLEPPTSMKKRTIGLHDIVKVVKYALFENRELSFAIALSSVIGAATLTYAWFVQPFFIEVGIPMAAFGILWTALNLTVGASSFMAHRVVNAIGRKNTMALIIISTFLGFIFTGMFVSVYALPILFAFYISRGIATPILKEQIHVLIDSDVRATILSLRNMVIRIIFAIAGPFLGWLTDSFSLSTALIMSGLIYLFVGIAVSVPFLIKKS